MVMMLAVAIEDAIRISPRMDQRPDKWTHDVIKMSASIRTFPEVVENKIIIKREKKKKEAVSWQGDIGRPSFVREFRSCLKLTVGS